MGNFSFFSGASSSTDADATPAWLTRETTNYTEGPAWLSRDAKPETLDEPVWANQDKGPDEEDAPEWLEPYRMGDLLDFEEESAVAAEATTAQPERIRKRKKTIREILTQVKALVPSWTSRDAAEVEEEFTEPDWLSQDKPGASLGGPSWLEADRWAETPVKEEDMWEWEEGEVTNVAAAAASEPQFIALTPLAPKATAEAAAEPAYDEPAAEAAYDEAAYAEPAAEAAYDEAAYAEPAAEAAYDEAAYAEEYYEEEPSMSPEEIAAWNANIQWVIEPNFPTSHGIEYEDAERDKTIKMVASYSANAEVFRQILANRCIEVSEEEAETLFAANH